MMNDISKNIQNAQHTSNRLARLVAVQVLYQASYGEETIADIIKASLNDVNMVLNGEDAQSAETISGVPDKDLLSDIVYGVDKNKDALQDMLIGALDSRFTISRMEVLLRMLLLAGAYELHHHGKIDAPIIISDYVDVTRTFFGSKEPGLVNAVLDKLAKKLR